MDKSRGNQNGSIVERFIKPRASTIFVNMANSLDGPGPLIAVSVPHEEFFNSYFGIFIGGKRFLDGSYRPIRMHKVCTALGLSQNRVEHISSLWQELSMRQVILVPGQHDIAYLMLALKEA